MTREEGMTKKELRKTILAQRRAMPGEEVHRLSQIICEKIRETDLYRDATCLCLYMPINNEVEADLLIEPALKEGKRVYIPKVIGDEMVFNAYEPEARLEEGAFHIRESASEEVLDPAGERDGYALIVMPGSVFDIRRHRIGYGGGYYDKYLSRYPMCRTVAPCFDFQIVEDLPAEDHDISPEMVVSEKRLLR